MFRAKSSGQLAKLEQVGRAGNEITLILRVSASRIPLLLLWMLRKEFQEVA